MGILGLHHKEYFNCSIWCDFTCALSWTSLGSYACKPQWGWKTN